MAPRVEGEPPRILLADDDAILRGMLRTALQAAGYDVEAVADGDLARESYLRRCPDVLIADLVMPGLNGQELAVACRARCPDTVMVFMSGYSEKELHDLDITQVVFMPKPLSPRDLVAMVGRLLAGRAGDASPSSGPAEETG